MRRRNRIYENFREACAHRNVFMQLLDVLMHKLKINSHWEDYYRFGFFRQDLSWEQRSLYVGYLGSRYFPWEGNSLRFDHVFQLKSLQKTILKGNGIATPPLVAKVGIDHKINSLEKLRTVLSGIDVPVVSKFDGGGSGVGIFCLEPRNGQLYCRDELVDAEWLWSKYATVIERGFIIEERAENHPVLQEIYPDSLNTVRLTTVKTSDNKWHLLLPYIKFGRGGTQVDNMSAGGMISKIDNSGHLGIAYCSKSRDQFEQHPDTNVPITGTQIPFFDDARALAIEASKAFGFMATVAWDVGITPGGPIIIEGNPFWDPQGVQDRLGPFLTPAVTTGLLPRACWTPWDRTHMYPNYMSDSSGGWLQRYMARRRRRG
jgi:hypothetical protein